VGSLKYAYFKLGLDPLASGLINTEDVPTSVDPFYSALLYATLRYSTLLYATLCYSTLLYTTLRYSTLLYATLRYSTLRYSTLFDNQHLFKKTTESRKVEGV
jgi:hypothetical protein